MTANKMPEMPAIRRAFYCIDSGRACETGQHEWPESPGFRNVLLITPAELAAHERACYLAGIAAARECVPPEVVCLADDENEAGRISGHNGLREKILSSIERMESEATK